VRRTPEHVYFQLGVCGFLERTTTYVKGRENALRMATRLQRAEFASACSSYNNTRLGVMSFYGRQLGPQIRQALALRRKVRPAVLETCRRRALTGSVKGPIASAASSAWNQGTLHEVSVNISPCPGHVPLAERHPIRCMRARIRAIRSCLEIVSGLL